MIEVFDGLTQKGIDDLIAICHENLKSSEECMKYLEDKRGFSKKYINKYKLGYFPQNVSLLGKYVPEDILQKLTIIDYPGHSHFCDYYYLIFPIYSEYKQSVGIGGRTLLDENQRTLMGLPKYKNSRYKKSNILFGLNESADSIIKQNNVYIVEGYFDHIAMDAGGILNSVAICGTAFSKNHFLKLARYTDTLTFILDRDESGIQSMERIFSKFANRGIKVRFNLLPEGCKDADEYFSSGGTSENFVKDLQLYIPAW